MMQAANLGWLGGFPVAANGDGVRWMTVPPDAPAEEVTVDGRHLSRATYALNKLRTELAPALPRLADDPDRWLESIEGRLELLKGAIHHGDPLPTRAFESLLEPRSLRDRAARLAESAPRLIPLLDALAWIHAGDPGRVRMMLDIAEGWTAGLELLTERLGRMPALVIVLRLLDLAAEHGRDSVEPLASCLFDRRAHDVATQQGGVCGQILGAVAKPPRSFLPDELPSGGPGTQLILWCEDLIQQSRRIQRQCLRLFALATPLPLVERWELWWETTRRLLREARGLAARPSEKASRHALRTRVEAHRKAAPSALEAEVLLERLRRASKPEASAWTETLVRAFSHIPAGALDSGLTSLFLYWSTLAGGAEGGVFASSMLAGFERYLKRRPVADPKALLRPWIDACETTHGLFLEDEIEIHLADRPRKQIPAVYEHLAAVAQIRGGLGMAEAKRVGQLFIEAGETGLDRDPGLTAAFLDSLVRSGRLHDDHPGHAIRLAVRLCRGRIESFPDVLKRLSDPEEQPELPLSEWPEAVLGPLCSGELVHFIRESILTRQLSRLLACGAKSIVLNAAGTQPITLPVVGLPVVGEAVAQGLDWMERYPKELHPQLRRISCVLPDAEARTGRWLADDLPDAARLEREIEAIQARLEQVEEERRPALRTRLSNLRARLEQPASPSAARIGRLRMKLDRAWGRMILDRWERDLDARLPEALRRLIGVEEIPGWLIEPRNLALVATAARLDRRHRSLAWRLFRERCGPPPWDLRDAPQNLAFRRRLAHLDWSPWLEGVGTRTVSGFSAGALHLRLEDDPLEVFRMGGHFRTCLSPGSFNYFSVFTNAADINKRVLYARDDAGRLVGRCLLALTAEGGLLTFQAYCHDGGLDFETICSDFADDLARRMGTERVRDGEVPTLVASEWYDDGARDFGHRFACLEERSELRRKLAAIRPGDLIAELRRGLKPARLNEVTLPLVLELPELHGRPELAVPLLRMVAECRALPDDMLITAARLGLQAGADDLVRRLFAPRLAEQMRQGCLHPWRRYTWTVEMLARLDPVRLLDVLRRTRPKSVRGWPEEVDGYRLEAAAAAHQALHRPRQAHALWEILATSTRVAASHEQRKRARAALDPTRAAAPRSG
jgi:hypothetical protein